MTMITPSYLGETIEYSSLHACRSTLEDPTSRKKATAYKEASQVVTHHYATVSGPSHEARVKRVSDMKVEVGQFSFFAAATCM